MNLEELSNEQLVVLQKVRKAAEEAGVDPRLAIAVAYQESRLDPSAKSPKGAIGVMQLMPQTAKGLGVNPADIDENIRGGVQYLKEQLDTFGDTTQALIAYNAGPNTKFFQTGSLEDLPDETLKYVSQISQMVPMREEVPEELGAPTAVGEFEIAEPEAAQVPSSKRPERSAEDLLRLGISGGAGAVAGLGAGTAFPEPRMPGGPSVAQQRAQQRLQNRLELLEGERAGMKPPAGGPVGGPVGRPPVVAPGPQMGAVPGAFERAIQGAPDEAFGTTGRVRQETYNTETARRAAASRGVDNPFTRQTWGATPSGVLAPPEVAQQQVQRADEAQRLVQQQTEQARQQQRAITQLDRQIESTRRNLQLKNQELDAIRKAAPGPLARAGAFFRKPFAKMIPGAATGLGMEEARQRYERGDVLGALAAAAGAGGSALMAAPIPVPLVKAAGAASGYGGLGALLLIDEMRRRGILPPVQAPVDVVAPPITVN